MIVSALSAFYIFIICLAKLIKILCPKFYSICNFAKVLFISLNHAKQSQRQEQSRFFLMQIKRTKLNVPPNKQFLLRYLVLFWVERGHKTARKSYHYSLVEKIDSFSFPVTVYKWKGISRCSFNKEHKLILNILLKPSNYTLERRIKQKLSRSTKIELCFLYSSQTFGYCSRGTNQPVQFTRIALGKQIAQFESGCQLCAEVSSLQ